jgi:hypothetical protein
MCGALGSMDNAFQKGVFRQKVLFAMQGDYSFFGSPTYSDDKFYFKQATAGLAYAAFTGQFPNVWGDTFTAVREKKVPSQHPRMSSLIEYKNGRLTFYPSSRPEGVRIFSLAGEKFSVAGSGISCDQNGCSVVPRRSLSRGTYILTVTYSGGDGMMPDLISRFIVP